MASARAMDAEIQLEAAAGLETGVPNGYTIVGEERHQAGAGWSRRSLGVAAAVVAPLLVGATFYAAGLHAGGGQHVMSFAGDGLIEKAKAPITCTQLFDGFKKSEVEWSMAFFSLDFNAKDTDAVKAEAMEPWKTEKQLMSGFLDGKTRNIQIYNTEVKNACDAGSRNVLWFYPMDDHNGAFVHNDWVCGRLATAYDSSGADCINIYRVNNPQEISKILDSFVHDGTVVHAVIGGHGSDEDNGVLGLGPDPLNSNHIKKGEVSSSTMFKKLGKSLIDHDPTIVMDSCFSGKNGIAKFASEEIPRAWVMGGIVSLDIKINMLPGENGPPRIASDFPSWANYTQAIRLFKGGKDLGLVTGYGAPAEDPNDEDAPQAETE